MPINEYGVYIRSIRSKLNINLEDMANKLNVSKAYLSALENGKKTIPQGRKMLNPQRRKMIRLKNVAKRGMITVALIASVVGFNLSKNNKDNFVSNFNEIEQYNISSSELNLSQDSLEQAQKLYEEIESLDMSTVSNIELASYFEQISDMQLDLMKEKVSNLIVLLS